jgi:hypothetical protein
MSTDWRYWRAELKAPGSQPRDTNDRVAGYYRSDGARTKPSWPVAVWYDEDGTPHVKVGNSQKDGEAEYLTFKSEATWHRCVAVEHADYLVAMETGKWISDGKHARHLDEAAKHDIDLSPGDNAAPVEESLADQIKALADKIDATPEPTTQEQANALSGHLDKMRALLRLAEAERVKLKEPHLQAGREIDATWAAVKQPGEQAGIAGEGRRKAFLRKEQARLDAIAEQERIDRQKAIDAENERIRLENEARFAEAQQAGAADVELEPEVTAPAPAVEPPRATAGSAFGRASGLKRVKVVDAIDYPVLTKHFLDVGDEDFRNYLMDRAKKATRAKVTLPGVSVRDEMQ